MEKELPVDEILEESDVTEADGQELDSETDNEDELAPRKNNLVKQLREELKAAKKALKEQETVKALKPEVASELRLFVLENPEAKEFKDAIAETKAKFPSMSLEEALAFAKATAPKESTSRTDFDVRGKTKPKDVSSLTEEEAIEQLSPSDYLKYLRNKGAPNVGQGRRK